MTDIDPIQRVPRGVLPPEIASPEPAGFQERFHILWEESKKPVIGLSALVAAGVIAAYAIPSWAGPKISATFERPQPIVQAGPATSIPEDLNYAVGLRSPEVAAIYQGGVVINWMNDMDLRVYPARIQRVIQGLSWFNRSMTYHPLVSVFMPVTQANLLDSATLEAKIQRSNSQNLNEYFKSSNIPGESDNTPNGIPGYEVLKGYLPRGCEGDFDQLANIMDRPASDQLKKISEGFSVALFEQRLVTLNRQGQIYGSSGPTSLSSQDRDLILRIMPVDVQRVGASALRAACNAE